MTNDPLPEFVPVAHTLSVEVGELDCVSAGRRFSEFGGR